MDQNSDRGNNESWRKIGTFIAVVFLVVASYNLGRSDKRMRDYSALKAQYDRLESEYSALKVEYERNATEYPALKEQYERMETRCAGLKTQYDRIEKERARAAANDIQK
jgi:predicted nuclease with TOPRIM domain